MEANIYMNMLIFLVCGYPVMHIQIPMPIFEFLPLMLLYPLHLAQHVCGTTIGEEIITDQTEIRTWDPSNTSGMI